MLDLSAVRVKYWDVKLPDQSIINIKLPTLRFRNELIRESRELESMDEKQQEVELSKIVTSILNKNVEERTFTVEQINNWFPEPIQNLIVNEYAEFIRNVANQKN